MKIAGGTRVGLCDHVTTNSTTGMVFEVKTVDGKILVLLCAGCSARYAVTEDMQALVTRQLVTGRDGWHVRVELEAPS
jgi:hypothetical protein